MQFTAQPQVRAHTGAIAIPGTRIAVRPNQEQGQTGPWTDAVIEAMRAICAEADQPSAAAIAARLNDLFDFTDGLAPITRNAVIGKCHRMRLSLNTQRTSSSTTARQPREPKPQRERSIRVARISGDAPIRLTSSSFGANDGDPRKRALEIAAQLDAHHQAIIDLFDGQDPYVDDETPFRSVAEIARDVEQPKATLEAWPDAAPPIALQDTRDCNCRYVTSRSRAGMHYFCGATRASQKLSDDKVVFTSSFCATHHAVAHSKSAA